MKPRAAQRRSPYMRLAQLVGTGTTASPVTLTSPTYLLNYYPDFLPASPQSFVVWKDIADPATATLRVLRAKYHKTLAYWLSVTMTSATWKTNLKTLKLGPREFFKPTHSHCVQYGGTTLDNTPAGGTGFYPGGTTAKYPSGTVVPYPVFETYFAASGPPVFVDRAIGDVNGLILCMTDAYFYTSNNYVIVRTQDGAYSHTANIWDILVDTTLTGQSVESTGIKNPIWPTTTYQNFGIAYVAKEKDWMPPIFIEKVSSTDVTFDAKLSIMHLDVIPGQIFLGSGLNHGLYTRETTDESGTDPLDPYLIRSDFDPVDDGLFRKHASNETWVGIPGSDVTGWTAPTSSTSCPFVVEEGTPP